MEDYLLFHKSLIISFVTLLTCAVVCFFSKQLNFVDSPDGIRKTHEGRIPLAGGLSLVFSLLFCSYLLFSPEVFFNDSFNDLFIVSFLVLVLGILDDIKPLPVSFRLIVQIIASWIFILMTDIYLKDLGNLFGLGQIYLGQLGIPITIFMVVGLCNAFNMLDGMDGLVALVVISIFASLFFIFFYKGVSYDLALLLLISLIIFSFFNLGLFGTKWKMFLGDSGSMWLGFITAWSLVILSQDSDPLISPISAIWLVLLPLIDALSTVFNRLREGKTIFSGDRTHIHYLLIDKGIGEWKVLLMLFFISSSSCGFSIIFNLLNVEDHFAFYGFLTIWLFYFLLIKYPILKKNF